MKNFKILPRTASLSFQNRLIRSYTFILVLILIVGIFLYQISFRQVRNGIHDQTIIMLTSSVQNVDDTLSNISTVAQQVSVSPLFNTLADYDSAEVVDFNYYAYKTQQELKTVFHLMQLLSVSETFVYMKNSGYNISASEFLSFESFARYKLLCTPEMAGQLEEILNFEANRNQFISLKEFDSRRNGYLYIYPIASGNVFSEKHIQSYLCCFFDQELMENYFSGLLQDSASITAYDSVGNVKLHISGSDVSENNSNLLSTNYLSGYNNWQYSHTLPKEQAYYSLNHYRNLFITITLLALVFEGIIVYCFSIINSKPVIKLFHELAAKEDLAASLNRVVEKHRPVVNESYIRNIMEGNVTTDDEMDYFSKELQLDRTDVKYQVLCMEVYPSEDFNIQLDDMALCLQNYDVLVRDALRRHFPDTGYIYKPSDRVFCALLASPDTMSYKQIMQYNQETFSALHQELLSQFGIWSSAGFGGINTKLSNTWKSYQQAKDAGFITTTGQYIKSYQDFINSNDVYYYPEIMSAQLSSAISSGSKEMVVEMFRLINKENLEQRSLTPIQKQQLIFDIRSTLFKKRHTIFAAHEVSDSARIDSWQNHQLEVIDRHFDSEMSLHVLKDIALELCEIYVQKNSSNELIVKIKQYITENYYDPSLCLTKISEEFGISENYFSFLFKKETGENFSGYLEKLRMAKAKDLVLNTSTSLSNLYQYLGYSNAASFRRVFKKTFGITPKEMRA